MNIQISKHFTKLKGYEIYSLTKASKVMGTLIKCKPYGLIEFNECMNKVIEIGDDILVLKKNLSKEFFSYKLGLLENIPESTEVLAEQKQLIESVIQSTDDEYAIICNDELYKPIDVSF
jgi:hypothetical protein